MITEERLTGKIKINKHIGNHNKHYDVAAGLGISLSQINAKECKDETN